MMCPSCGSESLKVIDSRKTTDSIRRRRRCKDCGERFTTYETISETPEKPPKPQHVRLIIDEKTYKLIEAGDKDVRD